jgi:hypothetical protein
VFASPTYAFFLECQRSTRVATSLSVTLFLYACIGKGQIFRNLGWVKPHRPAYWLYAIAGGGTCAFLVIELMRITGNSLGAASPKRAALWSHHRSNIEELIYRGAAFSVVCVTACSVAGLAKLRIALPVVLTSLLFA